MTVVLTRQRVGAKTPRGNPSRVGPSRVEGDVTVSFSRRICLEAAPRDGGCLAELGEGGGEFLPRARELDHQIEGRRSLLLDTGRDGRGRGRVLG